MTNPWLNIPLTDYEAHMALPHVGQAQLLSGLFADAVREYDPRSVAVVGCAGGSGFERIDPNRTPRVIGIDLNPTYIDRARQRFADRIPELELYVGDVQTDAFDFTPVDLLFAGLLFEYVNLAPTLRNLRSVLTPGGVLVAVLQLPNDAVEEVTPSPYASLTTLAPLMRLVAPGELVQAAATLGFEQIGDQIVPTPGGKQFAVVSLRDESK